MPESRRGVLYGVIAYSIWGLFPLYWPLLKPAGAVEILAHRMVWSLAVVVVILAVLRHWSWFRSLTRRQLTLLTIAAITIGSNWGTYIYAVNSGHIIESALGYFINPLVSVLFGVIVFRERLRPLKWAAVGLGGLAVLVLTLDYGRPPWIALVLAITFGAYGLFKKAAQVGSVESLTIETLVLLVPALTYLIVIEGNGTAAFGHQGVGHALLMATTGIVTAIPLMCFNGAAIRVPLSTIGLLQYITPTMQFLCGVLVAREVMPPSRWVGFAIVWLALCVFTWDSLRTARASRHGDHTVPELEIV